MKKYILIFLLPFILLSTKSRSQAVLGVSQYSHYIAHDTVTENTNDSTYIWIVNRGSTLFYDNLRVCTAVQDSGAFFFHPIDTAYSAGPSFIAAGDSIHFNLFPFYNISPLRYHYDINVIVIWPVAASAATSDSLTYTEVITLPAGINDIDLNLYVKAYPNPSVNNLTIENNSKISIEEVRIYDTNGQLLNTLREAGILNTEKWAKGVYVLDILLKNKQRHTIRVVKQ